jgi:hypothetical protein
MTVACFVTTPALWAAEIKGHVRASDTAAPLAGATVGVYLNCTEILVEVCNCTAQAIEELFADGFD